MATITKATCVRGSVSLPSKFTEVDQQRHQLLQILSVCRQQIKACTISSALSSVDLQEASIARCHEKKYERKETSSIKSQTSVSSHSSMEASLSTYQRTTSSLTRVSKRSIRCSHLKKSLKIQQSTTTQEKSYSTKSSSSKTGKPIRSHRHRKLERRKLAQDSS